jgi:hypothetical protein
MERRVKFLSSIKTVRTEEDNVFNSISIYVPSMFAADTIVDFDPAWVTSQRPLVLKLDATNYRKNIKGSLLSQWEDIFIQDTNVHVVLFVVVFLCDGTTANEWGIDDTSIAFGPLTRAFGELFHISWFKVLFDPSYDGKPLTVPGTPGTAASATVVLGNAGVNPLTVPAGSYVFNDGVKDWVITLAADITIAGSGSYPALTIYASTVGSDAALSTGTIPVAGITPNAGLDDLVITVSSVTQGTDAAAGSSEMPSPFFDLSLALAYLAKMDTRLSCFVSQVNVTLPIQSPDVNACWMRSVKRDVQLSRMQSLTEGDREKYYWAALYLMGCRNTWVIAHCEPVNVFVQVMAKWFERKNNAGEYVGNTLSNIRLTGPKIKAFGWPSWIDSEVNLNDSEGFNLLDELNVSYLNTISGSSVQDCELSRARGVLGDSITAQMIAKFVDYSASGKVADMITDDGTLTDPFLTDDDAYKEIQKMFQTELQKFTKTRRISAIRMQFPEFALAKQGLTNLEAAAAWQANYTDNLGSVTITGGLVEE